MSASAVFTAAIIDEDSGDVLGTEAFYGTLPRQHDLLNVYGGSYRVLGVRWNVEDTPGSAGGRSTYMSPSVYVSKRRG